jgi:hypothetical protein
VPISVVIQDAVGDTPVPEDAELWASELGLTYPVLADVDGEFFVVWDPKVVLPMAYIIDADGVVAWAEAGGSGGLDEIEAEVTFLLAGD